ncbi:MAG: ribonuclease HII [Opitutales bacterium]|nr:ribonuclease HII [Opitutales bacterium]MCH8540325.1 ribonuclease HII [Opitutales bacterium]
MSSRTIPPNLAFDRRLGRGIDAIVGVDEVGRGALAGPVVAGAVLLTGSFLRGKRIYPLGAMAGDSKQLSPMRRKKVLDLWGDKFPQLPRALGVATVAEVENYNVLGATRLAMERAVRGVLKLLDPPKEWTAVNETPIRPKKRGDLLIGLEPKSQKTWRLLIDGRPLRPFPWPHEAVIKGDAKSLAIGLASVLAKVSRDQMMVDLDKECPGYSFGTHKGYGSEVHREILKEKGPSRFHRPSFLRKILPGDEPVCPEQLAFF